MIPAIEGLTLTQAKAILKIMTKADGECSSCARELFERFLKIWPDHLMSAKFVWREEFGDEFEVGK